ncbi:MULTISPECIES: AAA-like domain-containing protein [Nostocales]|uniref:TIR domain-containing protein n=3 Tax=Nostocales TaxID=1161 RepID=A0A0C1R794_9CYAN|nr:AAA-like domain-containing protein [Tolypothrix bouteillei]KAF3885845.1 TIR domain-containing protein [Tolypothrix bouteillei VB521301]
MRDSPFVKTILILAANPKNTSRLRLDKEVQEIDEGLRRANKREQFKLEQRWAVRSRDFYRAILDTQPQIVHFCGHGAGEDGIVLEDEAGEAALVQGNELASMFKLFASESVECVVLNACYSEGQAEAIAQHVSYTIGTNQTIGDNAAIAFSRAFYDALAAGKTIEYAFELGSACLVGLSEHQTPVLKKKSQDELSSLKKEIEKLPDTKPTERKHIFISYKRNAEPDEAVALELYHSLSQHHEVFIDQRMVVGTRWAECIEKQLRKSDFLIVFLSSHSVHSEMVGLEIQKAHELAQLQGGRPAILPVRLAYREQFQYPLSAYLDSINWAFWQDDSDTPRLIAELTQVISGGELSIGEAQKPSLLRVSEASPFPRPFPSAQLEMPEGTMDSESQFYVERSCDAIALRTIEQKGVTIAIKGSRQVGKSSLLIRIKETAEQAGKRVAFLDFQLFDKAALQDGELFFRQFCSWVTDELDMEDRVDEYWSTPLGNTQRCTRYISRHILKGLGKQPLVLAMDEVDKVFDAVFRNDFFGMLRSWHNCRATTPIWKNFDLTLVTSTEPYQLIDDLNQSPFNVGQVIEMEDFSPQQVADLNQSHGLPFNASEERRLIGLLGGHPYLIRRSLYLVAIQQTSPSELFANATHDSGPFGDHLRHHLSLLHNKTELIQGLLEIIRQNHCADKRIFWRLRGAGLVREEGKAIVPRCQLYAEYFRENLRE